MTGSEIELDCCYVSIMFYLHACIRRLDSRSDVGLITDTIKATFVLELLHHSAELQNHTKY